MAAIDKHEEVTNTTEIKYYDGPNYSFLEYV